MNLRKAIAFAMSSYPEFYLAHPEALYIEVINLAAITFSMAEMIHELNAMESDKLCVSQREYNILKWRLTGAGRAWLRGA
jgi:hypothetical protein